MKLADHVDQLRKLIEAAFDKQFARLGLGKTKQMGNDQVEKLSAEVIAKRARFVVMLDNHIGETGSYESAREKLLDELTFTLFNRLAAIKVMEAASLFPPILTKKSEHGDRSFGHKVWLEMNPHMRDVELEGIRDYLKYAFDELGQALPLYSKAYPYALLPDALSLNDIIDAFNVVDTDTQANDSSEETIWQSDDVLGWMYESYNNTKKEALKKSGDKIEYNKVSLQSQVYTPRWVVQFLVENSLGKMYLEMYPHSGIKRRYKIANAPTIQTRKPKLLHEIRTIDPACGSGNFLLYAFDFYYELYLDQIENYGADYDEKDIPKLIIENNLHGIDLDDRGIQLAQLGLFIKAKKKRRTIGELNFRVVSSDFYLPDYNEVRHIFEKGASIDRNQQELIEKIWNDLKYAYKFGSLVHIDEQLKKQLHAIEDRAEEDLFAKAELTEHQDFAANFFSNLSKAVEQYARTERNTFLSGKTRDAITFLELLTTEYDIATANPPYTDSADFGPDLKEFIEDNYKKPYKFNTNLYATFIKRCYDFTGKAGFVAMLHPLTFMYIKTFEDVRKFMLTKTNINLLVELGLGGVFSNSSVQVDAVMYILQKASKQNDGVYFDFKKYKNHTNKSEIFRTSFDNFILKDEDIHTYVLDNEKLKVIKSWPFIYWISDDFRKQFSGQALGDKNKALTGLMTGNNNKFLRFFWEVDPRSLSLHYPSDNKRWVGYQKGGPFVRWYGNNWAVIDFTENGAKLATTDNKDFYFKEGVSYSAAGSKGVCFRFVENMYAFDKGGPCVFSLQQGLTTEYLLGFMNSILCSYIVDCLNPTVNRQVGDIRRVPLVLPNNVLSSEVGKLAKINVEIKKHLCHFSLIERNYSYSPFIKFKGDSLVNTLRNYLNYENSLLALVIINEAIIDENIFSVYSLTEEDKSTVVSNKGLSAGALPILPEARMEFLSSKDEITPFISENTKSFINALPILYDYEEQFEHLLIQFPQLYQGNNTFEDFCFKNKINPINVWYWFRQSKVIPGHRKKIIALEFLADLIRVALLEDEDGIIPLVFNSGKKVLLERIEKIFLEKAFSTAQYSSFDSILGKTIQEYIDKHFFEEFTDHLKLYKQMPGCPFIWHLTSGPEQGFDCYVIIYKWSRDNLLRLRSVYIENRERSLQNRNFDIASNESAEVQNEKARIFKQLKEIEAFKKKIDELLAEGYNPILDDGVGKNIAPLQKKKMLAYDVLNADQLDKYLNPDW